MLWPCALVVLFDSNALKGWGGLAQPLSLESNSTTNALGAVAQCMGGGLELKLKGCEFKPPPILGAVALCISGAI